MLANNVLKNIAPNATLTPSDLTTKIIEEGRIFEDAIVREQIFKLYSSRLVVEAE